MGAPLVTQAECDRIRRLVELGKPRHYIQAVTKRSLQTIHEVVARGYKPAPRETRPVPDGFASICRDLSVAKLAKKYRASKPTICQWIAQVDPQRPNRRKLTGRPAYNRVETPEGFRAFYEAHGWQATRRHYGASSGTMHQWVKRTGGALLPKPRAVKPAPTPANDIMAPPPGYEDFKRKLGRVRSLDEVAA